MPNRNQNTALALSPKAIKPKSSLRLLEAPRPKGAMAKGRKTPAGLAPVNKNSWRRGFLTTATVLQDESRPAFTRLLDNYMLRFRPADDFEQTCVEELAQITWRLQRLHTVEATMFNDLSARKKEVSKSGRIAAAFREMSFGPALPLLLRYEASLQRMRKNTLNNLSLVRKTPELNEIDLDHVTYEVISE